MDPAQKLAQARERARAEAERQAASRADDQRRAEAARGPVVDQQVSELSRIDDFLDWLAKSLPPNYRLKSAGTEERDGYAIMYDHGGPWLFRPLPSRVATIVLYESRVRSDYRRDAFGDPIRGPTFGPTQYARSAVLKLRQGTAVLWAAPDATKSKLTTCRDELLEQVFATLARFEEAGGTVGDAWSPFLRWKLPRALGGVGMLASVAALIVVGRETDFHSNPCPMFAAFLCSAVVVALGNKDYRG